MLESKAHIGSYTTAYDLIKYVQAVEECFRRVNVGLEDKLDQRKTV